MSGMMDKLKHWLGLAGSTLKEESAGGEPVATTQPGLGDDERETSTNAQPAGAGDEPWSGDR